ncbi:MAG: hypothetical protein PVF74_05855 [Anaerolineales bacterium]
MERIKGPVHPTNLPMEQDPVHFSRLSKTNTQLREILDWMSGLLYGLMFYEYVRTFRRERADLEHLFVLISDANLLGVAILPPISMRLLSYIISLETAYVA